SGRRAEEGPQGSGLRPPIAEQPEREEGAETHGRRGGRDGECRPENGIGRRRRRAVVGRVERERSESRVVEDVQGEGHPGVKRLRGEVVPLRVANVKPREAGGCERGEGRERRAPQPRRRLLPDAGQPRQQVERERKEEKREVEQQRECISGKLLDREMPEQLRL